MKIDKVIASPGLTGFYNDDQEAIRRGAEEDGLVYLGEPVTPGFTSIRQRGESVSIMLVLDDGQVAFGDCASVQYAGVCDRDPPFSSSDAIKIISHEIAGQLVGRELTAFRPLAEEFDKLQCAGQGQVTALRYGLTQALLDGVAKARKKTMTEVIVEEYDLPLVLEAVPIYAQTGDDRYTNVDKMILKRVDVLPHGLINNVKKKLGVEGELLLEYLEWIKGRIGLIGDADYRPALHFDVYGTIGLAFDMDIGRMADYIERLEQAAAPLELHIEHPVDAGSKPAQIETMKELRQALRQRGVKVQIVADEWANTLEDIREFVDNGAVDMVQIKAPDLGGVNNTIEAILYMKSKGAGACLAGSSNVTDRNGQVCAHIALATRPEQVIAVPGMGVDEGLMILYNEMHRTLSLLQNRQGGCNDQGKTVANAAIRTGQQASDAGESAYFAGRWCLLGFGGFRARGREGSCTADSERGPIHRLLWTLDRGSRQ